MDAAELVASLQQAVPDATFEPVATVDLQPTFYVSRDHLVAMIFLLFDIEVAFLYPWAMALRDLGWAGFVQVLLFMVLLLCGYVYVWRKGALDWGIDKGSTQGKGQKAA